MELQAETVLYKVAMKSVFKWPLKLVQAAILVVVTILLVWALDARRMADLEIWHRAKLSSEFHVKKYPNGLSLKEYLSIEERLFEELDKKVCRQVEDTDRFLLNRYARRSITNPDRFEKNWNRTFEMHPSGSRGGVLLLHGLSDSPYSLRRVGEILSKQGFYVLGLRLPGHGTIPAELKSVAIGDWLAATRMGANHVRQTIGSEKPFYLIGYSNGGALAVKYSLDALENPRFAMPDRLVLFSPSIGITPFAFMANWHKLLSFIPYFEKSKWTSIEPEYDPYKYNSFPKHAGHLSHRLTRSLRKQIDRLKQNGRLAKLPPVLTFQSLIDSTVLTRAVIDGLYRKLESGTSELVLFDFNRLSHLKAFLKTDAEHLMGDLEKSDRLPFALTLITNIAANSAEVVEKQKAAMSAGVSTARTGLKWPEGIYSLSHVAIPFAPEDMIYGNRESERKDGVFRLGTLAPRGERSQLRVSMDQFMRLRYNPFFGYIEKRLMRLAGGG